jgi:hypothetical protein
LAEVSTGEYFAANTSLMCSKHRLLGQADAI